MSPRPWVRSELPQPSEPWEGIPAVIQRLLLHRGIVSAEAAKHFLSPDYQHDLHDPFLYAGMDKAVDRLVRAIEQQEQVTIYGDYDADGICATATMFETLRALGAKVNWYVPERLAEGYGLNGPAVEQLIEEGTEVLVTVDCGTSNLAEITLAVERGAEVIVLDHHQSPPELPPALAIINPFLPGQQFPFQGHSSGGVTFTVARALLQRTEYGKTVGHPLTPGWEKWLLDLTAIATVADMMPLLDDNRIFVTYGLQVLRKTRRPGLRALFTQMGNDIRKASEYSVSFQIAPRLNAAGRLQHARTALELLLTTDATEAKQLAEQLQNINLERQRLTEMAVLEAMEQVENQGEQSAYVAFAPHWSPGIVGLIAGRIVERVWRPVVVMTENQDLVVGSGRSIPGFDITEHLRTGSQHFLRFGGHAGACGFTLITKDQRQEFSMWFQTTIPEPAPDAAKSKPVVIDTAVGLSEITPELLDALERLGPFGIRHERPIFVIEGATIAQFDTVGTDGQHLRLTIQQDDQQAKAIGFRQGNMAEKLRVGQSVDLAVELSWNDWNGRREPQIKVIDLHLL